MRQKTSIIITTQEHSVMIEIGNRIFVIRDKALLEMLSNGVSWDAFAEVTVEAEVIEKQPTK